MSPKRLLIVDVMEETIDLVNRGPPPAPELGNNLVSYDDCERWLLHPTNWIQVGNQIVYWNGNVPKVAARVAQRLIENPQDRPGFFSVIIREQYDLKHPKKKEKETTEDDTQTE